MTLEPLLTSPLWGDSFKPLLGLLEPAFQETLRHFPSSYEGGEVSLVFGSDAIIQPLNAAYRGKDKPTNVLSFPQQQMREGVFITPPLHPEVFVWGDIVFAHETISREALEQKKSFENHLTHLCIHGFLHLLGYDHETPEESERMEALEVAILHALDITDPYHLNQDIL